MRHLQLPLFSVQLLHLKYDMVEAGILVSPTGELSFETYISKPLDSVVDFLGKGVRLLIKGYLVGGIGADWLRLRDGYRVQVVEIDGGVVFELPTDNRVAGPLDFDEIRNARHAVFSGDL